MALCNLHVVDIIMRFSCTLAENCDICDDDPINVDGLFLTFSHECISTVA